MKLLLINPPIREWAKPNVLPLGLAYIASVLKEKGVKVEVLDLNVLRWDQEKVKEYIKNSDFDIYGIGAIVTIYKYVKWIVGIIKEAHPEKILVVGGSVASSIPEIILKKTKADIVCFGEGEATIVELIDALKSDGDLSNVRGIYFRAKKEGIVKNAPRAPIADLDSIPFPAWDLFPVETYLKNPIGALNRNKWIDGSPDNCRVLSMNLSGTRGCPYDCIYCYHDFMGQKYRHRSAGNIIKEMRVLSDDYNVKYFHFIDDEFCVNKNFVYDFCKEFRKAFGPGVTWGCTGRVNLMTEDLIIAMKEAGCVLIGYGIESGSQKMLDAMKKGVTVSQAKKAISLTKKHLGWADCSFMIGTPGEDIITVKETVEFCKELDLTPEVIFFTTPYPGTELYKRALAEKKIVDEEEYCLNLGEQGEKVRVNFTKFSDKELLDAQEWMISELNAWNKIKHPESR